MGSMDQPPRLECGHSVTTDEQGCKSVICPEVPAFVLAYLRPCLDGLECTECGRRVA